MAFVRALLRTVKVPVVTYGGSVLGQGQAVYYGFQLLQLDSPLLRPLVRQGPQRRGRNGRGHAAVPDCRLRHNGCRSCQFGPDSGSSVLDFWEGELKTVTSPYPAPGGGHRDVCAMPGP